MKKVFLLVLSGCSILLGFSQDCSKLHVDIKKGTLNGLAPTVTQEQVKKELPCSTASTEDGSASNCGGGVFYRDHNFYFYTGYNYINIRKGFAGTFTIDLFGKTLSQVTELLGKSAGSIDDEENKYYFFKTSYGCICLKISEGKVVEIFMYAKPAEEVDLCI
jgi:hypothetical protein